MRRLEHVGIAVHDVEETLRVCREVLGRVPYKSEEVSSQGVVTHFLDAGGTKIELLEGTSAQSPIAGFLEKRGAGVHHLAFEVENVQADADRLSRLGYEVLGRPQPGADGKRIVFLHPRSAAGVLIELCQQISTPQGQVPLELVDPTGELAPVLLRKLPSGARALGRVTVILESPGLRIEAISTDSRALTIGLGQPGDVSLPEKLWKDLPDPWALVADLVVSHLSQTAP